MLNEYRCTRRRPYGLDAAGHTNTRARQGHYIVAESPEEALRIMGERFAEDVKETAPEPAFDAELWKDNVSSQGGYQGSTHPDAEQE